MEFQITNFKNFTVNLKDNLKDEYYRLRYEFSEEIMYFLVLKLKIYILNLYT
jgi:hypothetical protein